MTERTKKFSDALGGIDDKYVTEALEPEMPVTAHRAKKKIGSRLSRRARCSPFCSICSCRAAET